MGSRIADLYRNWEAAAEARFRRLQSNERKLNQHFIRIYGIEGDLSPAVPEREVSVRRADLQREIRSLLSFAVGCVFGRYSVDTPGLCYTGGAWNASLYRTVLPTEQSVLPVSSASGNTESLTDRVTDFIRKVYGSDTLEDNLDYIANALGGEGNSYDVLSQYFSRSFFADHCRIYHKRPIYWVFRSGRLRAFSAVAYYHRWNRETVPTVLGVCQDAAKQQHSRCESELAAYAEKLRMIAESGIIPDPECSIPENYKRFAEILEPIP